MFYNNTYYNLYKKMFDFYGINYLIEITITYVLILCYA